MIFRHAFYEDAFMVLSHVLHPLRGVALCFLGDSVATKWRKHAIAGKMCI